MPSLQNARDLLEKALEDTKPIEKPAKRWRNKYRLFATGSELWGQFIWPCEDTATTAAMTHPTSCVVLGIGKHLGAFPVED